MYLFQEQPNWQSACNMRKSMYTFNRYTNINSDLIIELWSSSDFRILNRHIISTRIYLSSNVENHIGRVTIEHTIIFLEMYHLSSSSFTLLPEALAKQGSEQGAETTVFQLLLLILYVTVPVIMKCHTLGGLKTAIYCLSVLESTILSSRCQQSCEGRTRSESFS
jgi:hypothetical protein